MDPIHIRFIYRLVMTGGFKNILEVGCYRGASTSALVQSQIDGADFELTCCDVLIRETLRNVLKKSPRSVRIEEKDSLQVIDSSYDLIIIDGDHCIKQVSRELGLCLFHETQTMILHDTNMGYAPEMEGPDMARKILELHPDFYVVSDKQERPGMWTYRGLSAATRNKTIHDIAKGLLNDL